MLRVTGPWTLALVMETVEKNTDQGGNWTHNLQIRSSLLFHLFNQIKVDSPFDNFTTYYSATEEKLWRYFNFAIVITAKFKSMAACLLSLPRNIRWGLISCCIDGIKSLPGARLQQSANYTVLIETDRETLWRLCKAVGISLRRGIWCISFTTFLTKPFSSLFRAIFWPARWPPERPNSKQAHHGVLSGKRLPRCLAGETIPEAQRTLHGRLGCAL